MSVLLAIAILAAPGAAQTTQPDTSLHGVLAESARMGRYLRLSGTGTAEGRATGVSDEMVLLVGSQMRLAEIRRVEYRSKGGGQTAIVLGAVGAILVGAAAVSVASDLSENDLSAVELVTLSGFGGALGGALGAVVGFAVDRPTVAWHTIWPK